MLLFVFFFFFQLSGDHLDLHSFPTRRSSDLPISTKVPGIQICEHLPLIAAQMDKLAIIRSMIGAMEDRKSTRLNSSHRCISYAVFCLKKKKKNQTYMTYTRKTKQQINSPYTT